jgi:6-phosphogluconolactonase (cycloisomerase 2 family)
MGSMITGFDYKKTGLLTPTEKKIQVGRPVCLKFMVVK